MDFSPVKRLKVAEQVAGSIRDAILGGSYEPGDTLPSERELAGRFEVNRSSVREAIHKLEAWGLVEVRHGGGTRVREFLASAGLQLLPFLLARGSSLDPKMLMDLLHLRVGLLGWTGSRAAMRGGPEAVEPLREALQALRDATDPGERQALDFSFYEELVRLTDNGVASLLANAVRQVYMQNRELFAALYAAEPFDTTLHQAAVDAVAAGDVEAATAAMEAYGRSVLPGGGA